MNDKVFNLLKFFSKVSVVTYKDIAEKLDNKNYARVVVNSKEILSSSYAFAGIEEQKRRCKEDSSRMD